MRRRQAGDGEAAEGREGPPLRTGLLPLLSADFCHHTVVLTVFALHINRTGQRVLLASGSRHSVMFMKFIRAPYAAVFIHDPSGQALLCCSPWIHPLDGLRTGLFLVQCLTHLCTCLLMNTRTRAFLWVCQAPSAFSRGLQMPSMAHWACPCFMASPTSADVCLYFNPSAGHRIASLSFLRDFLRLIDLIFFFRAVLGL